MVPPALLFNGLLVAALQLANRAAKAAASELLAAGAAEPDLGAIAEPVDGIPALDAEARLKQRALANSSDGRVRMLAPFAPPATPGAASTAPSCSRS